MVVQREKFGITENGIEVYLYTIKNESGLEAKITNLGATLVSLLVPDRQENRKDVILGYDTPEEYCKNSCYFGTIVGRGCNRIEEGKYQINGKTYQLDQNDNENNLHSGKCGFDKRIWQIKEIGKNSICLSILENDMENGYPGNLKASVTYTLTEDNQLILHYQALSDKDTVVNMTNHSYFNLGGHDSGSIEGHELILYSDYITPVRDAKGIATGKLSEVTGTPYDFRNAKLIGRDINAETEQMKFGEGYDINYVIKMDKGIVEKFAEVYCSDTGICMEAYTDLPGFQFYAGNKIPSHRGKNNVIYEKHQGLCLESEYFPNSINIPNFAKPILRVGEIYDSYTCYKFSIR